MTITVAREDLSDLGRKYSVVLGRNPCPFGKVQSFSFLRNKP
jgi:hypothetical protein